MNTTKSTQPAKSAAPVEPKPKALPSRSKLRTQLTRKPAAPAKTQRADFPGKQGGHPLPVAACSVVSTATPAAAPAIVYPFCIGMYLGDLRHSFTVLDTSGTKIAQGKISNEYNAVQLFLKDYPDALVVIDKR
jgi:hypothetical protein